MTFEIVITLLVVAGVLVLFTTTRFDTDVILVGAMVLIVLLGVLTPDQALQGFASPGVLTIAALYVVVAGLRETGAMAWISRWVLGKPTSLPVAQTKLMLATGALSSVINNTPVVALFIPIAQEWASRFGYSISRLLLPMNHVVILAGTCTLIGTSTNLIVNSLLTSTVPDSGLGLFDLAWVGVPITLIGIAYVLLFSRRLLPERQVVDAAGVRIGLVHDAGPARGRLARMRMAFPECAAVVFGHSHIPLHEELDGFQIFNPGSPTDRRRQPRHSMGIARVARGHVNFEHVWLDQRGQTP